MFDKLIDQQNGEKNTQDTSRSNTDTKKLHVWPLPTILSWPLLSCTYLETVLRGWFNTMNFPCCNHSDHCVYRSE